MLTSCGFMVSVVYARPGAPDCSTGSGSGLKRLRGRNHGLENIGQYIGFKHLGPELQYLLKVKQDLS